MASLYVYNRHIQTLYIVHLSNTVIPKRQMCENERSQSTTIAMHIVPETHGSCSKLHNFETQAGIMKSARQHKMNVEVNAHCRFLIYRFCSIFFIPSWFSIIYVRYNNNNRQNQYRNPWHFHLNCSNPHSLCKPQVCYYCRGSLQSDICLLLAIVNVFIQ